jgi:hypothetical protein
VDNSAEIYDDLVARLGERASSLADQIREEVARGRLVQGSKLPVEERELRESRLTQAGLGKIGKDDVAVLPYTGDQRLALLCQALATLARSMAESRRSLLSLVIRHELPVPRVLFAEPDDIQPTEIDLVAETQRAEQMVSRINDLLTPVLAEVGE